MSTIILLACSLQSILRDSARAAVTASGPSPPPEAYKLERSRCTLSISDEKPKVAHHVSVVLRWVIAIGNEADTQVLADNLLWWNPSMGSSTGKTRFACTSPTPETMQVPDTPLQIWAMADT
jgi:hypothetical protein